MKKKPRKRFTYKNKQHQMALALSKLVPLVRHGKIKHIAYVCDQDGFKGNWIGESHAMAGALSAAAMQISWILGRFKE